MLTAGQIAHFETFGFLVLRQMFPQAEVSSSQSKFDAVWSEASGGQPWSEETTESRQPFCEIRPPLTKLVADDRIYGAVEQLLGPNAIWGASGAARYVGDSGWHGDDYDGLLETYRAIKVVMYLEPVEQDTGCLRIIPGSHHRSFKRALRLLDERDSDSSLTPFGVPGSDTPGYPIETQPTDLLIFDTRAYHGSFGGRPGRSNIQMVFFPEPASDEEVETLRQIHDRTQYHLRVPKSFLNSERPRLRRMVSRLVEWGFETSAV